MFGLYDVVTLKKPNVELKIESGFLGAIIDILNGGEAYSVEFVDSHGNTIEEALFTEFREDELELVEKAVDIKR